MSNKNNLLGAFDPKILGEEIKANAHAMLKRTNISMDDIEKMNKQRILELRRKRRKKRLKAFLAWVNANWIGLATLLVAVITLIFTIAMYLQ